MERYSNLIQEAASLLTSSLWEQHREALRQAGDELDGVVLDIVRQLGRQVVEDLLNHWSEQLVEESTDRLARIDEGTFSTILGPVDVKLPRLRARKGRQQTSPMQQVFGVGSGAKSPRVRRALTDFGAEESFERATRRLTEHYGWEVGRTSMLRVVQSEGQRALRYVKERLDCAEERYGQPGKASDAAEEVFVQLDGSMVRTATLVPAQQAGRSDLPRDKSVRVVEWREVRVGLAHRPDEVDPTYVAARADYEDICHQLFCAAANHGLQPETLVIATADGGNGLREGVEHCFARTQFILDHPHFVQHVHRVASEQSADDPEAYAERIIAAAWNGHASELLAELRTELARQQKTVRRVDAAPELKKFIDYLEDHEDAVHYAQYEDNGWPIGSGRCESAHRHIPQARMKIPGACWHPESVNPMLALRTIRANGWWDDFWQEPGRAAA